MVTADENYGLGHLVNRCPVNSLSLTAFASGCHTHFDQPPDNPVHPVLQVGVACFRVGAYQSGSGVTRKNVMLGR